MNECVGLRKLYSDIRPTKLCYISICHLHIYTPLLLHINGSLGKSRRRESLPTDTFLPLRHVVAALKLLYADHGLNDDINSSCNKFISSLEHI